MSRGTFPPSCLPVFYLPELLRKRVRHLGDATLRYMAQPFSVAGSVPMHYRRAMRCSEVQTAYGACY
jgi:hypothetical protein